MNLTTPNIHPTSIIDPKANIEKDVVIGPYCIVEADVTIGAGTTLGSYCVIKTGTRLGHSNLLTENVTLGGPPQDIHFDWRKKSYVHIGDDNTFREFMTVHRSAEEGKATIIGNKNLFMCHSHVGHDTKIGSRVILTCSAILGGYVQVEDQVFIGGHVGVHQRIRIGRLAMLAAVMRVTSDVPPFILAAGHQCTYDGINAVGLRRANVSANERLAIKKFYKDFYNASDREVFLKGYIPPNSYIKDIVTFIEASKHSLIHPKRVGED